MPKNNKALIQMPSFFLIEYRYTSVLNYQNGKKMAVAWLSSASHYFLAE